ncbi:MAG: sulfotransferase [Lysobacteraceae bacterium]
MRAIENEADALSLLLDASARDGRESPAAGHLREWLVVDARFDDLEHALPPRLPTDGAIEDAVLQAVRLHRQRDFRAALAHCDHVLRLVPGHGAALAHRGRALHNIGQRAEALASFELATKTDPLHVEAWHYFGIALRAAGRMDSAANAFQQALALRPAFRAASIDLAKTLLAADRLEAAREILDACQARFPGDAGIKADLGFALHRLGRLEEARIALLEAVRQDAYCGPAWLYLGAVCNELSDRIAAESSLKAAAQLLPNDPEVLAELATLYETTNQIDLLRTTVAHGLRAAPGEPRLTLEAARLQRRDHLPARALEILRTLDPSRLVVRQQRAYWYETARNLDLVGRHDDAWIAFANANALARDEMQSKLAELPPLTTLLHALESAGLANDSPGTSSTQQAPSARSPVFLLGFSRSGITLLNTMLGTHPGITTLEERPTLETCIDILSKRPEGYPACLSTLGNNDIDALRDTYWQAVAHHSSDDNGRKVLIDTFPLRTMHVGLIQRLFPDARIIFVQRHPADVVLSNLMQDYATNPASLEFTTLQTTANVFASVMRIWQSAMHSNAPTVHTLCYEDLIRTPRQTLLSLLEFIAVPWDEDILSSYRERARDVRISTSSYHQVVEPLNDRSIDRWHKYRDHLAPVLPLLSASAASSRYVF